VHDGDADGNGGIEGAAGNAAERKRHCGYRETNGEAII
jgi:hypothetical protein